MKWDILHRTRYSYASPVRDSFNEVRLQPPSNDQHPEAGQLRCRWGEANGTEVGIALRRKSGCHIETFANLHDSKKPVRVCEVVPQRSAIRRKRYPSNGITIRPNDIL